MGSVVVDAALALEVLLVAIFPAAIGREAKGCRMVLEEGDGEEGGAHIDFVSLMMRDFTKR
jgi:hypothetical protein